MACPKVSFILRLHCIQYPVVIVCLFCLFVRFCSLIGYSEEEVKSALVLKLVETGQLDRARAMCRFV